MAAQYKTIHPVKYYRDFLAQEIRPDGRAPTKTRTVTVNVGSVGTADGSAIVRIGNTTVVCGIKAELGKPKAEEANCGFLVPNVELAPLCSPKFRPGPPSEEAQVMTYFVDDVASHMIDRKQLCISHDNLAWVLHADMICLDYDGSVLDACVISLLAALRTVNLPAVEYDVETNSIEVKEEIKSCLKVDVNPIPSSFAIFDDEILLADPTGEEESLASAVLSVVTDGEKIYGIHKPGGSAASESRLQECISVAKKRASLIKTLIDTAISSPER